MNSREMSNADLQTSLKRLDDLCGRKYNNNNESISHDQIISSSPEQPQQQPHLKGIKLSFLRTFINEFCSGEDAIKYKSTTVICESIIKPLTTHNTTFIDVILKHPLHSQYVDDATVFVSHAWNYNFLDLVDSLESHFQSSDSDSQRIEPCLWIDLFTNCQHDTNTHDFAEWTSLFFNSVRRIGSMLMVFHPYNDPIALTRAWCIFELLACIYTNATLSVTMPQTERFKLVSDTDRLNATLTSIRCQDSRAAHDKDKQAIHEIIQHRVGFETMNLLVCRKVQAWLTAQLQMELDNCTQRLGEDDPDTLRTLNTLAYLLNGMGSYLESEAMYRRCWIAQARVQGPTHKDTLTTMNNLSGVLQSLGRYEEAKSLYQECLDARKISLGDDHPDTLTTFNNLAVVLRHMGKHVEAEKVYRNCLELQEHTLGKDHPNTLMTLNNLALNLVEMKDHNDAAEAMYRQCLTMQTARLGQEHPDTLTTLNNLASLLASMKRYDESEKMYRDCLDARRRILVEDHPNTLKTLNNLALLLSELGSFAEAEKLFVECFEARRRSLGEDHPETRVAANNLALTLSEVGRLDEAEALYRESLEIQERVLGGEHPDTLITVNNLASILSRKRKFAESERLYRRCVDARKQLFGAKHPDTLDATNNLALLLHRMGKYDESEKLYRLCV